MYKRKVVLELTLLHQLCLHSEGSHKRALSFKLKKQLLYYSYFFFLSVSRIAPHAIREGNRIVVHRPVFAASPVFGDSTVTGICFSSISTSFDVSSLRSSPSSYGYYSHPSSVRKRSADAGKVAQSA